MLPQGVNSLRVLLCSLLLGEVVTLAQVNSFMDMFLVPNASRWNQTNGVMQTPYFDARPSHLHYNRSLPGHSGLAQGLVITMDQFPCKENPKECCGKANEQYGFTRSLKAQGELEECAIVASGHLKGVIPVHFGKVSTVLRTPYTPCQNCTSGGSNPPSNVFSCVATYTNEPEWNEIDMCWHPLTNQLDASIWIEGTQWRYDVDLGFDPSIGYHEYSFVWTNETVTWYVDGKAKHTMLSARPSQSAIAEALRSQGVASLDEASTTDGPARIPWLPQTIRVIQRPLHVAYIGPADMAIQSISYDAPSELLSSPPPGRGTL